MCVSHWGHKSRYFLLMLFKTGAGPNLNALILSPCIFCTCLSVMSLNLCLPECCLENLSLCDCVTLYIPNKRLCSLTNSIESIAWGKSEGYFTEIFKSFTRESLAPNDPDKKQTQIKQYLNKVSAFMVDIHLYKVTFSLYSVSSKWLT